MRLRTLYVATLGLLIGYVVGQIFVLVLSSLCAPFHIELPLLEMILRFAGLALGLFTTFRAADELSLRIGPAQKKKDLLIDTSVLLDARILDVAASGLFDHHLILPHFCIQELQSSAETNPKAKRALEIAKKLEALPGLHLRTSDVDFPDIADPVGKMARLARHLNANILTADSSRVQMAPIEGLRIINLHSLSNALKPLMQTGEQIKIKIQRYGKEPRQGVGYLEDGTMVVVNGGGDFLGEETYAHVLSVKHTTSGRMVFCNALESNGIPYESSEEQ